MVFIVDGKKPNLPTKEAMEKMQKMIADVYLHMADLDNLAHEMMLAYGMSSEKYDEDVNRLLTKMSSGIGEEVVPYSLLYAVLARGFMNLTEQYYNEAQAAQETSRKLKEEGLDKP